MYLYDLPKVIYFPIVLLVIFRYLVNKFSKNKSTEMVFLDYYKNT